MVILKSMPVSFWVFCLGIIVAIGILMHRLWKVETSLAEINETLKKRN